MDGRRFCRRLSGLVAEAHDKGQSEESEGGQSRGHEDTDQQVLRGSVVTARDLHLHIVTRWVRCRPTRPGDLQKKVLSQK